MEYYSAINKQTWVRWTEVDETKACYTKWSKSEKEKYHVLMYIYGIKIKQYWWTYLQSRNRNTDVEYEIVVEGEGGMNWQE